VWIPKYRRRILTAGTKQYLERILPEIVREMPGCEIIEMNIQPDHIHAVMVIPPKYAVSAVIGRIKGQIASRLRKKLKWLRKVYWAENVVWSPGYCASTVGLEEKRIIAYVKWQEREDTGQEKLEL
jgi:putative transposase